jgi:hypothetical protein
MSCQLIFRSHLCHLCGAGLFINIFHLIDLGVKASMRSGSTILALCGAAASCIGVAALLPTVGRPSGRFISMHRRTARMMVLHAQQQQRALPDEPMEDRFDRWRLLQNILDLQIEEGRVEALVETVVAGSAVIPPGGATPGARSSTTNTVKDKEMDEQNGDGWSQYRNNVLALERRYLPDPYDEKDAFDSLWDTVAEIHGRDAVKIDLRVEPRWPYICCLARILLQYDFLTRGIAAEEEEVEEAEEKDQESTSESGDNETVLPMKQDEITPS